MILSNAVTSIVSIWPVTPSIFMITIILTSTRINQALIVGWIGWYLLLSIVVMVPERPHVTDRRPGCTTVLCYILKRRESVVILRLLEGGGRRVIGGVVRHRASTIGCLSMDVLFFSTYLLVINKYGTGRQTSETDTDDSQTAVSSSKIYLFFYEPQFQREKRNIFSFME